MSVSCKSFSLSFVLRAWAKCRLEFLNVLTPDFQLVDFLFLTRCKGTKNWWAVDRYWPLLTDFGRYWPLLLGKCNEISCIFRCFFVTLHRNNNKEEKNDEKLLEEWVGSSSWSQLQYIQTLVASAEWDVLPVGRYTKNTAVTTRSGAVDM